VLESVFPVCLLNLVIGRVFAETEDFVVVFPFALLQLALGVLQQLLVL